MTVEERVAALEARIVANEKASDRALQVGERALDRAEAVLTKRFDAANEVRGAMNDASKQFVTRGEFQWAIGAVVLLLIGLLVKILTQTQ